VVEGTGLENRRTGNGIESSNLSLSASSFARVSGFDVEAYMAGCVRKRFEDGWLSGLRRTPGKCVYVKAYRGFESHPVRWRVTMYVPRSNAESDPAVMFDFIEANPLGILVTAGADGMLATHLPLVVHRTSGAAGVLEGHVARANPHHRQAGQPLEALVIFPGANAYISPSWYATKQETGEVVPTWNYVAVHVYGELRFTSDPVFLRRHLEQLVTRHESGRQQPWAITDAPAEYIARQIEAIVGLELTITRMEGKWKMSQNRSSADIDGVVRALRGSSAALDQQVAEIVERRRPNQS
jgi:transcriptional regulator